MFKRMSILLRRPQDSRDVFAQKWEHHGSLVSKLPLIRSYLQNHVVEEYCSPGAPDADGIVELRFDRPEDMAAAFAHQEAAAVKADEPGFLGHGTGYALANDSPSLSSPDAAKLVVVVGTGADQELVASLLREAASTHGFRAAHRDDVGTVIARPEMQRGPQQVSAFVHLLFDSPATASAAAARLSEIGGGTALCSVFRVRTVTVIPKAD